MGVNLWLIKRITNWRCPCPVKLCLFFYIQITSHVRLKHVFSEIPSKFYPYKKLCAVYIKNSNSGVSITALHVSQGNDTCIIHTSYTVHIIHIMYTIHVVHNTASRYSTIIIVAWCIDLYKDWVIQKLCHLTNGIPVESGSHQGMCHKEDE